MLGTPVLTANTSSLPEVAGDAALKVNPYSVSEIGAALRALDKNEDLRAMLAQRGRVQAALFDESVYARRLSSLYRSICAAPPRTA